MYLPSGRRYDELDAPVFGYARGEVWTSDPWPGAVRHQRQLLQTVHVDRLLARAVARLRDVGLYDECLLVVTSDHGGAFVPGQPFKDPTSANLAEIMAVPLFVKLPRQRDAGRVDDRNVETIDVMPTLADALGARVPWPTDGASALAGTNRALKRMFWSGGRRSRNVNPSDVAEGVRNAARRRSETLLSIPHS